VLPATDLRGDEDSGESEEFLPNNIDVRDSERVNDGSAAGTVVFDRTV
jgi:hypothetical protein